MGKTNEIEIDEKDLDGILAEVEKDLMPVLKNEAARLSKAKDEGSPPPKDDHDGDGDDSPPPAEESSSAPPAEGSSPEAPPAPPMAAGPEASAPPDGSAPPPAGSAPPAAEMSPHIELPADPAAMAQALAAMPPEQIKAIYLGAKQAIVAMGSGGVAPSPEASMSPAPPMAAGPEASAPPAAPMAPPMAPPAGPPQPPMMGKGEVSAGKKAPQNAKPGVMAPDGNGEPVLQSAKKSEVDDLKNLVKQQNEKIELLTRAVTHMAGTPVRKAVTGVSHIAKSEIREGKTFSKSEMNAKLSEKIRGGKLEKKDRENIRRFFDNGSTDLSLVQHLLTE